MSRPSKLTKDLVATVECNVITASLRLQCASARDNASTEGIEPSDHKDWEVIAYQLGVAYRAACKVRDAKRLGAGMFGEGEARSVPKEDEEPCPHEDTYCNTVRRRCAALAARRQGR